MMIREQMGDWQIFARDCVVRAHQLQRRFMVEVLASALHRQLRFRQ